MVMLCAADAPAESVPQRFDCHKDTGFTLIELLVVIAIIALLVTMLGAIAAFENDLRKERQTDGIALAKRKGVQFGRKKALSDSQVEELRQSRAEGKKIADLMVHYDLSKATVYRALGSGLNELH